MPAVWLSAGLAFLSFELKLLIRKRVSCMGNPKSMRLTLKTKVNSNISAVINGFDQKLFLALNPPFPQVKLKQFDGCETGDVVSLELNFLLFKQVWTSEITEESRTADRWYFVDVGVKLPFFLSGWEHEHIVEQEDSGSVIIDHIQYRTGTLFTDLLMYPALMLQFAYRRPIYRRFFRQ